MLAEQNAKKTRKNYIIISVFLVILFAVMLIITIIFLFGLAYSISPSSSIAIIGGADGPTQITVASHIEWYNIIITALISVIALVGAVFMLRKIKK